MLAKPIGYPHRNTSVVAACVRSSRAAALGMVPMAGVFRGRGVQSVPCRSLSRDVEYFAIVDAAVPWKTAASTAPHRTYIVAACREKCLAAAVAAR